MKKTRMIQKHAGLFPALLAIAALVAVPCAGAQDRGDTLAVEAVRTSTGIDWAGVAKGPAGNTQVVRRLQRPYPGSLDKAQAASPGSKLTAEDAGEGALSFVGSTLNLLLPPQMAAETDEADITISEVLANENRGHHAERGTDYTVVLGQRHGGIPVFEAQCRVSMTQYGEVWSVNNRLRALNNPPTKASLSAGDALSTARQALGDDMAIPDAAAVLFIHAPDKLVWRLNFLNPHSKEMLVDAVNGEILMSRKNVADQSEAIPAIPPSEKPQEPASAKAQSSVAPEALDEKSYPASPLEVFDQDLYELRKQAKEEYLTALSRGDMAQEYVPTQEFDVDVETKGEIVPFDVVGGIEDFEGNFPGNYWFCGDENSTNGYVYWDDVSCEAADGTWSAWCADIGGGTDCVAYENYQDAYMYIECEYQGTVAGGDNLLYHKRLVELEDNYDYFAYRVQGYVNNPGHGVEGTPDASSYVQINTDSSGWESKSLTLGTSFDTCKYLRITFYFHSDHIVVQGRGAYVDTINFNGASNTAIYPYEHGFPFNINVYLKDVDNVAIAPARAEYRYDGGSTFGFWANTYRPSGGYYVSNRSERDTSCLIRGKMVNAYLNVIDFDDAAATCEDDGALFSTANGQNSYTATCNMTGTTPLNAAEGGVGFVELMRAWDFMNDNYSYQRPLCTLRVDASEGPNCYGEFIHLPNGRCVRDEGAPSASVVIDDTMNHEYGHALQWKVYGDTWGRPTGCTCVNHAGTGNDCSWDALREGWATYFPVMLYNHINSSDTHYDWTDSVERKNIESNTETDTEERDEYTIAGVFFDLYDTVSDAGDALSGADNEIWVVMRYDNPGTFEEFFQSFIGRYPGWADELEDICIAHNMDPDWLTLNRTSINFGGSSTAESFTIRRLGWYGNTGTPWNQPDWSISEYSSWITSVSPGSGTTQTETDTITVNVDRTGLSYGMHYASVYVTPGHYGRQQVIACQIYQGRDNYEENDSRAAAYIGFNEGVWLNTVDGYATQFDDDWYQVYITPGFNRLVVECDFVHAAGNINVAVYNSAGTWITSSYTETDDESIDFVLPTSGEYYYIRAYWGNAGNEYNLWWDDLGALDVPTGVAATDGSYTDKVRVFWNTVTGATHYKVWRATSAGGTKTEVSAGWIAGTYFDDTGATPGATYYYFVQAASSSSGDLASSYSSYNTGWRSLSAPTSISASDGTSTGYVHANWPSVTGASHYRVYRSATVGGAKTAVSGWQASTTFDDTTATPGATYYYYVSAATSSGGSRASDYSAAADGWRAMLPPTGVSASDGMYVEYVFVTWNPVTGASHYHVTRSVTPGGAKTSLSVQTTTTFNDTTATPDVTYYYFVEAGIDSSGTHTSYYSDYDTGWRTSLPLLSISGDGASNCIVSWSPATTGWVLQETWSLQTNWVDSASGSLNPVTIPLTEAAMFYRLRK